MNELTKEGDFLVSADKKVRVPMMLNVAEFQCAEAPDCQVLRLLYRGGAQEMVLILPKKVDGLADVEKSLSAEKLADCLARTRGQQVQVLLPKFKVTGTFMLAETLGAMGMPLAFDSAKADFKGMNGGTEPLWIGQVIHKTFVDVNEAGTEAAAATAIALEGGEAPKPVEFHADHPFVFLLRDLRSGAVLFMGRVVNPRE
jgi:serpin B